MKEKIRVAILLALGFSPLSLLALPVRAQAPLPTYHTQRVYYQVVEGEGWHFVAWSFDDCGGRYTLDNLAARGWRLVALGTATDPGVGSVPVGVFEVTGAACLVGNNIDQY